MAITQRGQLSRDDNGLSVGWVYAYTTATGATVIKATPGMLHTVTINSAPAGTKIGLYDNAATANGTVAVITLSATPVPVTLTYDIVLANGLVLNAGTSNTLVDITTSYI